MRRTQNHKLTVNYFANGCDYDVNPELSAAKQGFYRDAKNMRLYTGKGNIKRIYGETLKYYTLTKRYTCIGAIEVLSNIFEVWVSDNATSTTIGTVIFRINDSVMLQTTTEKGVGLGFDKTRRLQIDNADNCSDGLVALTDDNDVPFLFSVTDIIANFSPLTEKYFANFDPALYSVNLTSYNDHPVFRQLIDGELEFGQYSYSIRFSDKDGNKTKFGIPTPMIPVPLSYDRGNDPGMGVVAGNPYPYNKTYGGNLSYSPNVSPYGIRIQFRINNILNYEYVEVRRIKVNLSQGINETPVAEIRPLTQNLIDGEVSVWTFDDDGSYPDWDVFTDDESTDAMAAIESCKSVRFYNNHLVLGNVKLASKDLTDTINFTEYHGDMAFPVIEKLGTEGYNSPYNTAYKKGYMGGERYGIGVACVDAQQNVCFIVPVDDSVVNFNNYKFPERREVCSAATFALSETYGEGVPRASDIDNNTGVYNGIGLPVHEKFMKGDVSKFASERTIEENNTDSIPYSPYTPISPFATDRSGARVKPNTTISTDISGGVYPSTNSIKSYDPKFSIDYYGMGIAIAGIEGLPSWVTAFCVVRTSPANRVVCQGLTTYSFNYNLYPSYHKSKRQVAFWSDDVVWGLTPYLGSNTFINKEFQPVSPLGYFTEFYSGHEINNRKVNIDAMIYARDFLTDPSSYASRELEKDGIPPTQKYWAKFGTWRNNDSDLVSGTTTFNIDADSEYSFKNIGYDKHLRINLGTDFYQNETPQLYPEATMDCNDRLTKNWHEPFYIANIIDDDKEVPDVNQQDFLLTGHYQKIKSKIGEGNDKPQTIELLDERHEDCCVNSYHPDRPTYIYIKDKITGIEQAWFDVTVPSTQTGNPMIFPRGATFEQTVCGSLAANGYYDSVDPQGGGTVRCYGVYGHIVEFNNSEESFSTILDGVKIYTIEFKEYGYGLTKEQCIPAANTEIIVKYDKRFPIKVFGGDTIIGETYFPLVDGTGTSNGGEEIQAPLFVGMPFSAYSVQKQLNSATAGSTLPANYVQSNVFREIVVTAILESRVHLPYCWQAPASPSDTLIARTANFPRQHYVIRPIRWDSANLQNNFGVNKIDAQYKTNYPLEYKFWQRGGIRSWQRMNIDYSKGNNYDIQFGKPKVGFEEKTEFCTRVMWSLARNINVQDDPNLKTFLSLNNYDISDAQGEIKYLWDCDSDKGNNLYAITSSGTCLLITDKRTISDINATELFIMDADRLVKGQYWLSRNIGSNNEMWRGIAEYNNMLYIPNSESVYLLVGLAIKDILRENTGSYYERLQPVLEAITNNIPIAGAYNIGNKEYWLYIGDTELDSVYDGSATIGGVDDTIITPKKLSFGDIVDDTFAPRKNTPKVYDGETFIFKVDKNVWTGSFDYRGDIFLSSKGITGSKKLQVLLLRNYETYDTNLGSQINGEDIVGKVELAVAPEGHILKGFIDQTINSTIQPTSIELSNTVGSVEQTQTYTKDYAGWYYQVPRKATSKIRFQGRYIIVSIYNSTTGEYEINSVESGYKIIK